MEGFKEEEKVKRRASVCCQLFFSFEMKHRHRYHHHHHHHHHRHHHHNHHHHHHHHHYDHDHDHPHHHCRYHIKLSFSVSGSLTLSLSFVSCFFKIPLFFSIHSTVIFLHSLDTILLLFLCLLSSAPSPNNEFTF